MPMSASALASWGMAPVAGRIGRLLGHRGHDPQPLVVVIDQRAAWPLAVLEAGQAFGLEAAPPLGHGVLVHAHDRGDLAVGDAIGGQQHDPGPLGGTLGVVWARTRRCSSARSSSVITSGGTVGMRRLLMPHR